MATKPMPRIRAGISGSPAISSSKRSVSSPDKSKELRRQHKQCVTTTSQSDESSFEVMTDSLQNKDAVHTGKGTNMQKLSYDKTSGSSSPVNATSVSINSKYVTSQENLKNLNTVDANTIGACDPKAEVHRLKELMMLQVSLISRQQDLLKLRDKEILHLKTANDSYKSRLERMERRISLSRRHSDVGNLKGSNRGNLEGESFHSEIAENRLEMSEETEVFNENTSYTRHFNNAENETTTASTQHKRKSLSSPFEVDGKIAKVADIKSPIDPLNNDFTSPVSMLQSTYAANGYVPVPMSFIDRCRSQLIPMVSPDKQDASEVASIGVGGFDSPKLLVLKVCDSCSHCAAMSSEIKASQPQTSRIIEMSEEKAAPSTQGAESSKEVKESENGEAVTSLMRTEHSYYIHNNLRDEQFYRFTDLEEPADDGSHLNIPTWRINKYAPLSGSNYQSQEKETKENLDEEAYLKRHSRLEISEKRRKRWDIQRIREFRYNEKLRQKLMRQGPDNDVFETFAPSLSNLTAIEVQDNLPINIFGHSLLSMKQKEFSLPSDF